MSKNTLRWITVIIPIFFWVAILTFSGYLFGERHSMEELLFTGIVVTISSTIFSLWVFRYLIQRESEIQYRAEQLESLNSASLALTTDLEISSVLQKVVDLSRQLVKSRYGALGVLSEDNQYFEQFLTSGMSDEDIQKLDQPPQNRGLFNALVEEGRSLRIDDIDSHAKSFGFPKNHPSMSTLLGVPIISKGKVIGDIYLADKVSPEDSEIIVDFDDNDQRILEMFATQAAIAIDNAKLYRLSQDLVLLRERERFGMDLHDGIIQSIYAVGLMLEDIQKKVTIEPDTSSKRISKAIVGLNDVIRDLRNYILDLRPQRFQGKNVVEGLQELSKELRVNTLINIKVDSSDVNPEQFTPQQTVEILHIAQEALTNIRKHARANKVEIRLVAQVGRAELLISDNGRSMRLDEIDVTTGNGLGNMRERAKSLNGSIKFEAAPISGTTVKLELPLDPELITE
ncbi:MAG: GAF domain-containing sensor histidine kinase [Chloroflexota bacterium]